MTRHVVAGELIIIVKKNHSGRVESETEKRQNYCKPLSQIGKDQKRDSYSSNLEPKYQGASDTKKVQANERDKHAQQKFIQNIYSIQDTDDCI